MSEIDKSLLILTGGEVARLLQGQGRAVSAQVREAYRLHGKGATNLPLSIFLRFPDSASNRIIAMPGYAGGAMGVAGVKWIGSFPGNRQRGIPRASALIALNSTETGRPLVVMEGSIISARRTAASAAIAAVTLMPSPVRGPIGLMGAGPINREVLFALRSEGAELEDVRVFDLDPLASQKLVHTCLEALPGARIVLASSAMELLEECPLVSIATDAREPHIRRLGSLARQTILHLSLRDIVPEVIAASDNVVDDFDHVCRAGTSIELACRTYNNREFVRCTLPDLLLGRAVPPSGERSILFSPFGLAILDLAVANFVYRAALETRVGVRIPDFALNSWE